MGLEDLTELEILEGCLSLVFISISFTIGIKLMIKYFSFKKIELITMGLTLIFLTTVWWIEAFSFLLIVFFDYPHNLFIFFLGELLIHIAFMCWIYTFANLTYPNLLKKIVLFFLTITILHIILLIIIFYIDPELWGTKKGALWYQTTIYSLSFQIFMLITVMITGIIFAKNALRSEDPVLQLKGRFLLAFFISFVVGSVFSGGIYINQIVLIIFRILLISSAFEFYFGVFLPDRVKKWLIKPDK